MATVESTEAAATAREGEPALVRVGDLMIETRVDVKLLDSGDDAPESGAFVEVDEEYPFDDDEYETEDERHEPPGSTRHVSTVTALRGDRELVTTITQIVRPAAIAWDDLRSAVVIEEYPQDTAPWDDCDGLEHTWMRANDLDLIDVTRCRGYHWRDGWHERGLIRVDGKDPWQVGEYAHARGAAKQVAAELAAMNIRRTIEQLKEWYSEGWHAYLVTLIFAGVEAQTGSSNDDDMQTTTEAEVVPEVVEEVAAGLEQRGYTITGRPPEADRVRARRRARARGDVHAFDIIP